jgi:tryptophan 2,3-dioxygenase
MLSEKTSGILLYIRADTICLHQNTSDAMPETEHTKSYEPLYYGDYLHLPTILNAQTPRSASVSASEGAPQEAHDEMLFIITHQAYELWFKQILHELDSVLTIFAAEPVPENEVARALQRLERVRAIGPILLQQIDVMETMTPMDFLDFRGVLYPASGFQSAQFRLIEIKMGLSHGQRVLTHLPLSEADKSRIRAAESEDSLFTLVEQWLERMPFIQKPSYSFWEEYRAAVQTMFAHDRTMIAANAHSPEAASNLLAQTDANEQSFHAFFDAAAYERLREDGIKRLSFKATQAALFMMLYREYPLIHLPYRFLAILVELDELFSVWRYRHAQMAMRMIGAKVGTGGTGGHDYLMRATAQHRVFSDFAALSAYLIPRQSLPPLPSDVASMLGFVYIDTMDKHAHTVRQRMAAEYVKSQIKQQFPGAYLLTDEAQPDGHLLRYTFPDERTANAAQASASMLTSALLAEQGVRITVSAAAVHTVEA